MKPRYSIVIPLYEEEAVLLRLYERLAAVLGKLDGPAEMIFVVDGGQDRSFEIVKELRARDERVDMIVGGLDQEDIFKPIEAKRLSWPRCVAATWSAEMLLWNVLPRTPFGFAAVSQQTVPACGSVPGGLESPWTTVKSALCRASGSRPGESV